MPLEMMGLFSRRVSVELWRLWSVSGTRHFSIGTFPTGQVCSSRSFSSGRYLRTDAFQPDQGDKIDLDLWKSVMRSQTAVDESIEEDKEQVKKGDSTDSPSGCVLAATRELVSMWRQAGKLVPDKITDEDVKTLAELTTKSSKKKYLKFLAIREGHKNKSKEKQEKKRAEREQRLAEFPETLENRPPVKNSFLMQYRDHWLDRLLGWRGAQAMNFGQPLVFDMSYEAHMTPQELTNSVSQMLEVESCNRRSLDPFHLHLCNLQPEGGYRQQLVKRYGEDAWDRLLITETPQRHVDVFPQEQLVYLTADSPNVLRTFDPSKVYVVGAMVDRSIQTGRSFATAKRLQMATARLPLDQFLRWEIGAKTLTLDQMIRILLTIKDTGSWEQALAFVPKRKHDGFYQEKKQSERGGTAGRDRGDRYPQRDQRERQGSAREPWGAGRGGQDRGVSGKGVGMAWEREYKQPVTRIRSSQNTTTEDRRRTDKTRTPWYQQD
ncbi:tRNA methyltransferase 10 homolog C [Gadus morhua]|uniref:tRNA methyltransferase 10 homolog C n=1 Tax=Gadus morhua TaxID=8049 RepID=UPI0011B58FAE|nr:tRNA methyltransferase 10 homolog C [Gadus morhua]